MAPQMAEKAKPAMLDRVDATNTAPRSVRFGPLKFRIATSATRNRLATPTAGTSTAGLAINPNSGCCDLQGECLALVPPASDIATSLTINSPGAFSARPTSACLLAPGNLLRRHARQVPVN